MNDVRPDMTFSNSLWVPLLVPPLSRVLQTPSRLATIFLVCQVRTNLS